MFGLFKRIFGRKKQKETEGQPKTKLTRAERKQLNALLAKVKKRNNSPATAQDTIPYLRMYPDGICQLDEKHFSKTVQYFDINYELSHHDEKLAVLEEWGDFLNFFDPSVLYQFNYVNLQDDAVELSRSFDPVNRNCSDDPIAGELKTFLENVYAQGSNDQARLKFCTFTVTADNLRSARMRLNQVEGGVKEHMNRLGCSCEIMDGKDRLRLLHTIFHLDKREKFNFEWKWLPLTGLSTKDFIAPSSFEFRESRYFKMGEKCASVSAIQILASRLDDTMLAELLNLDNSMVVTLHVKAYDQAEAIKVVKQKLSDLDRTKIDEQMKAARSGYDIDILPADLNLYGKAAREILDMLQSKDQRMFLLTFLIMNTADSKSKLKAVLEELKSMTQPKECPIIPLDYQQEDGMVSTLPLGVNKIEIQRIMTTSALAVLIPFRTMEWADTSPEALYCGVNSLTHNMILVDRKGLSNGNAIILGKPGGGKSMVAKTEIEQVKYYTHDDIMICDPESEYSPMVWAMLGQVIRIAPNSTDYINPLDINLESYAPGESPLQLKAEFVLSLCELMLGDKEGLQTIQKSVIDAALQIIYRPFFADPRKENLPILGDLYAALREMNTERADNVADALEIYVTGSLNLFNHQTNVDVNNRVVCYDIRDLGTQLKPAGMFIVQEQVWSRVAANREKGKYTRYYMDEFHVLLQTPQTAAYSVQIWKRFRKYGGLPMGITQNINDLTRNQGTDNILNNTSYIYMLNQSAGDRKDLAQHLNLSPHQLKKVTDSAPGVGLLYCENAIIPIESHIPENTELYKLMTTKPQEVYLRNLTEGKNYEG